MTLELLHIPYSPWSEKASWALSASGIAYRARVYQPLLGEPELRLRLRRWRGPVSVPVLFGAPEGPLADSFAIARFAARSGSRDPDLVPTTAEAAIERFNDLSERGLRAGRARALTRVLASPAALREMIPRTLRRPLGPLGLKIAALGVERTLRKYGADRGDDHLADLRAVLDALRDALAAAPPPPDGAPRLLLPEHGFTYADIAMSQVLGFVSPPDRGLRIGRATRHTFVDPDLADASRDLLAWRDALYARYRGEP